MSEETNYKLEYCIQCWAHDALGIYPAAVVRDGKKTERTEWQDGYNAAVCKMTEYWSLFDEWIKKLPPKTIEQITTLTEEDELMINIMEDNKIRLCMICSDVFAWACSDAEEITVEELDEIYAYYEEDPKYGLTYWICKRRQMQPQKPLADRIREAGLWTQKWDDLPKNTWDC